MLSLALILAQQASHVPTSEYEVIKLSGFTVMIHPHLREDKPGRDAMVAMLDEKLVEIGRLIPEEAFKKLKTTKIWLDRESKSCPAAVYHPSAQWLSSHGFNPDMEKSVELGNVKNVLNWTKHNQPFMVLHELAHAYHHQHVGYGDKAILAAFRRAKDSGKYEDVAMKPSGRGRHYGLNNEMEFFAEATEAYFGLNDFQPFDRKELKSFDPEAYQVIEAAWGVKPPRPASSPGR